MKKNIDYKDLLGEANPIKRFPLLLEAALDEFSKNKFDDASLNDILKKATMSKGSFYHHFGDKFGLYVCLADTMISKKLAFFMPKLSNTDVTDFFAFMRQLLKATVEYMLQDERTQLFANKYLDEPESLRNRLLAFFPFDYNMGFKPLIESSMKAGTISSRFSPRLVAQILELVMSNAHRLIGESEKSNAEAIIALVDQLLDILQHGIAADKEEK